MKLDINCFCVNNCESANNGGSIGGIFYILDGNQNLENNVMQYMTARACSSQKKCIHYVAAANDNLETHVLYSNFSNCFTTLSTEHVFSFVDTKKILKYNTFEGNVVQANNVANNKKGYMLSLNNTSGNKELVNRIEYCNFIGNVGPEAIVLTHNANLDLLNSVFHNHGNYHIIDCDDDFYANFNNCVVDQDTTVSWTGDAIYMANLTRNINQPTHTLTFFATHNCHAAISISIMTPYETPYSTPFTTPDETPYETPFTTPIETPELTPQITVTPYQTPLITPYKTPYTTISEEEPLPDEDPTKPLPDEDEDEDPTLTSTNEESSTNQNGNDGLQNNDNDPSNDEGGSNSTIYIIIGCVCGVLVIIAAVIVFIIYKRKHSKEETAETSNSLEEPTSLVQDDTNDHDYNRTQTVNIFTYEDDLQESDPFPEDYTEGNPDDFFFDD